MKVIKNISESVFHCSNFMNLAPGGVVAVEDAVVESLLLDFPDRFEVVGEYKSEEHPEAPNIPSNPATSLEPSERSLAEIEAEKVIDPITFQVEGEDNLVEVIKEDEEEVVVEEEGEDEGLPNKPRRGRK